MRGQRSTSTFVDLFWMRSAPATRGSRLRAGLVAAVLVAAGLVVLPLAPASAAPTNTLSLQVLSARTEPRALDGAGVNEGDAITAFKFIINEDNTGSTQQRSPASGTGCSANDPGYPASCDWPSIRGIPHTTSPIYAQGDQGDLAALGDLPDGRYLISVTADGYKLDGAHFTMPMDDADVVTVEMQPTPLPDSTLRGQVFADMAPTNGTMDVGDDPLPGFVAQVKDTLGEVSTDVYGNPLCTTYVGEDPDTHQIPASALDADQLPVVDRAGGECVSDPTGLLTVPHLGPNRYTLSAIPPDNQTWIQTTTLEGNHDWDSWVMEGATGYDTEFAIAGEPVPQPLFGFARPGNALPAGGSGHVTGVVVGIKTYTPPKGGSFNAWNGNTGTKVEKPISRPWLSLADLQSGDQAVWVGRGNADGSFDISGVPDGNYLLTWWDEPQDYNVNLSNVTVQNGRTVDLGTISLNGWWTQYEGYVFNDLNRNGVKDSGEPGVPNFAITMRKQDNTLFDRGQNTAVTDSTGHYWFESAYPLGEWTVMEAYNDAFYTTGITYQTDNQPTPTTVKGAGVDVSVLNIIGLSGRIDWGVHAYSPSGNGIDPRNGGIVGSVSYDTTRNELDPQYAASEDWQPGVSDIPVELYATVDCGTHAGTPCDADELYELAPDGSYATGPLLNTYVSEHFERPTGCVARDVDGNPLTHGPNGDENVLAPDQASDGECISSFIQGVQFGPYPTDQGTPDASFGAAVDGNYGFGDGCTGTLDATDPAAPVCQGGTFAPLDAGDYLVRLAIPDDALGNPMYRVTGEENINIGNGNQIVPQVPPPACAGALHTVDLLGDGTDGYPALVGNGSNGVPTGVTVPASTPVDNATFLDIGGSPYEGSPKPRCDTKLVGLNNGKSVVPMFNIFTDVPVPSRLRGLVVDDINFSTDSRSTMYGEKAGVPFVPVGIYDFHNRLVETLESDFNGTYEVLLPSTDFISCPTPSGVCANMYRFVANDPGVPGRLNPNFNPRFRSISTEFEAMPGVTIPTDLAPTQVGVTVESPTTGVRQAVTCPVGPSTPQLFAVSQPYVDGSGTFTIRGTGFGPTKGTGRVTLGDTVLPTTAWNDTSITVTVPSGTAVGARQLHITADNGNSTVNGLTFHVRGGSYQPTVREVGPGRTYATIQGALDAALTSSADDLVVVYPGQPTPNNPRLNPRGAYYENLVMASPVKLQGVGPGGFQGSTFVPGSIIDAGAFGGDTDLATAWYDKVGGLTWDGNQTVSDGQAIYVLASQNATTAANTARQFTSAFPAGIDGFDIRGGDQQGFPTNINDLTGLPTGLPPEVQNQGGAVFVNAYARHLQITNNVVENNGGAFGTIRIGTPDLPAPDTDQQNENIRIAANRIVANAGTNLAGAIGIFAGADDYEVTGNDICGNFSLEYGGGLSVYGRSPNGRIHHNRIYLNSSNDEGGGVMIAGQLPANPDALSPGTGPVEISHNQIQANIANDDGGGIRFLMAGSSPMTVVNNMIVNNVSTHEGGGISLNDASDVRVLNNTLMKNLTTATAVTSDGQPAPAGMSTSANSDQLQASLPSGSPGFSNPLLFNNIFWDNRAGTRAGTTVTGLGVAGDTTPVVHWDMGSIDGSGPLAPTSSILQTATDVVADPSNSASAPDVVAPYDVSVSFATWRQNPAFVDATLVTLEAPADLLGDYHLAACPGSPACNLGAAAKASVPAPATDIDDQPRPALGGFDAGADEFAAAAPPPPTGQNLYFSTLGNTNPTGVSGTADDADLYLWDGTSVGRAIDLSQPPYSVPLSANVDGFSRVDATHFYVSFATTTTLPGALVVADEDVVFYDNGTWLLWFDGSAHGLGGSIDVGATAVVGTTLYFSINNNATPPGAGGTGDNADVYRWNSAAAGNSYTRVFNASGATVGGLPSAGLPSTANVDGLVVTDESHLYVSFSGTTTAVPGVGAVEDEDVVLYDSGTWSTFFDGTAHGLGASGAQDVDAISFPGGAQPPPAAPAAGPTRLYLTTSTLGENLPGIPETTVTNDDVISFDGSTYRMQFDASDVLPASVTSSSVNAVAVLNPTTVLLSFSSAVTVPGVGGVQPHDVVRFVGTLGSTTTGAFSLWFDGSDVGLTTVAEQINGLDVLADGSVVLSTLGGIGVTGISSTSTTGSDLFRCAGGTRGASTSCTWSWYVDGSDVGLSGTAESINGVAVSGGSIYLTTLGSFSVSGVSGNNRDVVVFTPTQLGPTTQGSFSPTKFFVGSANGLTNPLNPVGGIDLP